MATVLKRLRFHSCCCPHRSAPRYTSSIACDAPWRPTCIRAFSSATHARYPPPSSPSSDAPIIGENVALERTQPGFWSMGEESDDLGGDEDFEGEDLTATGHAELDAHRELREFSRIIAWEMPLLSSTTLTCLIINPRFQLCVLMHIYEQNWPNPFNPQQKPNPFASVTPRTYTNHTPQAPKSCSNFVPLTFPR